MATLTASLDRERQRTRLLTDLQFDYVFAALATVSLIGVYIDGWAHNHLDAIETFFTPWHALLYGSFIVIAAFTWAVAFRHRARGAAWRGALPPGYGVSLVGIVVYWLAGTGDFIWHSLFGFEVRVEALLSPTHIGLLLGGTLIRTGPLRAAWLRAGESVSPRGWRAMLPMLLSAICLLSSFTFFTQYVHPWGATLAAADFQPITILAAQAHPTISPREYAIALGIASVLLQTAVLMALVLVLADRFGAGLPFGWLTLLVGANAALMVVMRDDSLSTGPVPLLAGAIFAGLVGDVAFRVLRPDGSRVVPLRTFAFVFPVVLYATYFAVLAAFGPGIWWTIPMWSGLIVIPGGIGWLLSFVVQPRANTAR